MASGRNDAAALGALQHGLDEGGATAATGAGEALLGDVAAIPRTPPGSVPDLSVGNRLAVTDNHAGSPRFLSAILYIILRITLNTIKINGPTRPITRQNRNWQVIARLN